MFPTLYHYTCDHSRAEITETLLPAKSLLPKRALARMSQAEQLLCQFVWLTDLTPVTVLNAHRLGLNRVELTCDRTANRYRVLDDTNVARWLDLRQRWLTAGRYGKTIEALEATPGADPARWYVSAAPVAVTLDMHKKG